jgi:DNA-binding response OmpR family regulator
VHVLIVEDNHTLAANLRRALRRAGMAADVVHDADAALEACSTTEFDVVVLDRRLPTKSGDEVCAHLIAMAASPRVLMVTSMARTIDEVEGLNIGADDYIAKPFEMPVLVARVRALARRPPRAIAPVRRVGNIEMDTGTRIVTRDGRPIRLSRNEFGVLEELLAAQGAVVSAEVLLERVWDLNADPFTNAVRITMMTLRRKLGTPDPIITERGVGYRLADT